MNNRYWCNNGDCGECTDICRLDSLIACSPCCDNLTDDGNMLLADCVKSHCDAVYSALCIPETMTADDIIGTYGNICRMSEFPIN